MLREGQHDCQDDGKVLVNNASHVSKTSLAVITEDLAFPFQPAPQMRVGELDIREDMRFPYCRIQNVFFRVTAVDTDTTSTKIILL